MFRVANYIKRYYTCQLSSTTRIGSNSCTIFPEVMGQPLMITTKVGCQGSFLKATWWSRAKSLYMKQELALVSRSAGTWSWWMSS